MTITHKDLFNVLDGLSTVLPYAKQINEAAALLIWESIPQVAREQLTPAMLTYAAAQRMLDPDPPKEVPTHIQLLRYLYRLDCDRPNFFWGLKEDLPQRMALPGHFHPQPLSQYQLELAQGPLHRDTISPNGALAQLGWQP